MAELTGFLFEGYEEATQIGRLQALLLHISQGYDPQPGDRQLALDLYSLLANKRVGTYEPLPPL